MADVVVTVDHVSKKFCKSLKRSMLYGMQDIFKNMIGRAPGTDTVREGEFWAVRDVSFELKKGQCIGLIGPNGAGKSTLLKMLNGIFMPDQGAIAITGRVGALIELGAGFHPMLTGRENIYINGSILGFSKKEIDQKFDSIVEFSGLKDFIDTPVKYYSSGMYVRLGFAVAAHMEPDVLLIDEVLAVGDAGFRAKCYDAIYSLLNKAAVIFVSHNMAHINRMCNTVLVLDKGKAALFTDPGEAISFYLDLTTSVSGKNPMEYSNGQAHINNLQVKGDAGPDDICSGKPFEVAFELSLSPEITSASVFLSILSREQTPVAASKSMQGSITNTGAPHLVRFVTPQLTLAPEKYSLSISIFDDSKLNQILWNYNVCPFQVGGKEFLGTPVLLLGQWYSSSDAARTAL